MLVKGPMEIAPITPGDSGQRLLRSWQIGQILEVRVINQDEGGTAKLQIGRYQFQAHTSTPLTPGEPLRLRVVSLGEQPVLERLHTASPANETYAQALRNALPRQGGLGPLLANLSVLARSEEAASLGLPGPLKEAAREVFSKIPGLFSLTQAEVLKASLANAGLFLEAKLASQPTDSMAADLKANLLRLATLLGSVENHSPDDPVPPPLRGVMPEAQPIATATLLSRASVQTALRDLATQVEASLARIEIGQLSALSTEHHPCPNWLIDLPVREGETVRVFQFRIEEEEGHGKGQDRKRWSVTVAFELDGLGSMHARLTLFDRSISAYLWAEQTETYRLFERHLKELRQELYGADLETVDLRCFHGKPTGPALPSDAHDLVDVRV